MNNSKFFFFIVFGIYHVAVFSFAYYLDVQQEEMALLSRDDYPIGLLKQITFAGLFLFLVNFGWSWYSDWNGRKKEKSLQAEVDHIKAKMYDMQAQKEASTTEAAAEPAPDQD